MVIRKALSSEFLRVRDFYWKLIDDMDGAEYFPKWQKGIYPEDESLRSSLEKGELFIGEEDGLVIAAMVVNRASNEGYRGVSWPSMAGDDEVSVLHLLGVAVAYSGKGKGREMVEYALDEAGRNGSLALRLDVLEGNDPAVRLYRKMGFTHVEKLKLFYEDTGWCDFNLYEKSLARL